MRRPLGAIGLALAVVVWSLAGCGPTPAPPAALVPSATPSAVGVGPAASTSPQPTYTATSRPTDTPVPTFTLTPIPTHTQAPASPLVSVLPLTPTFPPTPPPAPTAVRGQPAPLALDWWYGTGGHLTDGAVVSLGGQPAFVVASLDGNVYALDQHGQVRWRARLPGPVYALALLEGERLAVGDDAGCVTLLDASGRQLWQQVFEGRITALHAWRDGLLAGGWNERLTFLGADGEIRWRAALGGPASAVAALPEAALVSTLDGVVRAFDATGTMIWEFEAGAPVSELGSADMGGEVGVLVGTQDGRLVALDADGVLIWQQVLGQGAPVWQVVRLSEGAAPGIAAGTGGDAPTLTLLSAAGEVLWRVASPAPAGAIAALDLDRDGEREVVVGLADGQVAAYDGQGRLRRAIHAGLPVWGLAAGEEADLLVLADVVARRIAATEGPAGGPWLPPPAMVQAPPSGVPAGAERKLGEAILVFLGDVAPGRSMEAQLARYGSAYPWEGLGFLLREADLAAANLECVLTAHGASLDKRYLLGAHPRCGQTLVEAGFDLVTLANNHALDYGQAGLEETLDTLDALGIAVVGAGLSRDEAHHPAVFTVNGVKVAILGYAAARWNGSVDVPVTDQIAWAKPARVQADVRAVRDSVDVVVVLLHAGTEYAAEPSADQVAVARAAVEAGADLVVGHHPHVTQTVERYRQGLIVYSLGDALFDIPRPAAMLGDLLRVHVTQEGLVRAELWPFWIEGAIRPQLLDDGQGNPQFETIFP